MKGKENLLVFCVNLAFIVIYGFALFEMEDFLSLPFFWFYLNSTEYQKGIKKSKEYNEINYQKD